MSAPVTIPADSIDAVRLIIEEAAGVLAGHAKRMDEMAAPNDWKSKAAAAMTADHVKKLAWVHSLLNDPEVIEFPIQWGVIPEVKSGLRPLTDKDLEGFSTDDLVEITKEHFPDRTAGLVQPHAPTTASCLATRSGAASQTSRMADVQPRIPTAVNAAGKTG